MDIKTELHNLKTMVLTESHISDNAKEKIANRINQIEKGVVMNYIPCCESDSELLAEVLCKNNPNFKCNCIDNTNCPNFPEP